MAANVKVLVVLALLQLMSLHAVVHGGDNGGVSAVATSKHEPKPKQGGGGGGGCHISGFLHGKAGKCNRAHGSDCCVAGRRYPQFRCSPPVSSARPTPATLTLNSFARGGDGGGRSSCDGRFHPDTAMVVALSSGWLRLDGARRCNRMIRVAAGNGRSALARVVDECDSVNGCDAEHNFEPPCPNNVVDGSPAVWKALGLDEGVGEFKVTCGRSVVAKVVDECDSVHGCDGEHNYEAPCDNNIVDASPAVWDALGLDKSVGMEHITWSDSDGDE
uniref:Ripening-related protein 4 n=1 Tax=Oryza meridionalis TaxID=40149 RepID=A0A0E0EZ94_9ORYZ